ncbi:MAG: hypothetical protein ACRDL1_00615 [Solirubrobacterales bacterium]
MAAAEAPGLTAAPVNWRAVRASASRLTALARRLRAPDDVRPQGVARAELLLTHGGSALYTAGDGSDLWDELTSTLVAL